MIKRNAIKRYVAFMMVLIMIFITIGNCLQVYAVETSQVNYETAKSFLMKIKVINEEIASKLPDDSLTRAEFAGIAFRLYNGLCTGTDKTFFSDVTVDTKYYKEINALAENGIILGSDDSLFRPNDTIEFWEAITIVLRIMGCPSYPKTDYRVSAAKNCNNYKLLPKNLMINSDSSVFGLTCTVYELINQNMFFSIINKKNDTVQYKQSEKTLLENYFDIYKTDGVLICDGITDINAKQTIQDNMINVNGVLIKNEGDLPVDYLGCNVEAYFCDKNNPELVAIYKNENNKIITINSKDVEYSKMSYRYYPEHSSNKSKSVKIDTAHIVVIYNNRLLAKYSEEKMKPKEGIVSIIDNDSDGKYDIVNIKDYSSMIVSQVYHDTKFTTVIAKEINGNSIKVNFFNDEPCVIRDSDGKSLSVNDIKENCVLSAILYDKDNAVYANEAVVSKKQNSGIISGINDDESFNLQFDDTDYCLSKTSGIKVSDIGLGIAYKIYMDFMGNVVYLENENNLSKLAFGYLLDAGVPNKGIDKSLTLKIFDELGRIEEYKCRKKVKIDGVYYQDVNNAYNALLTNGKINKQLILFGIDENQLIRQIDTAEDYIVDMQTTVDNQLIKMNGATSLLYRSNLSTFGGKVFVDVNTKFIVLPHDYEDEEEQNFQIISQDQIIHGRRYNIQGYKTSTDSPVCNFAVITPTGKEFTTAKIGVVTKIYTTTNNVGEETYAITVYDKNGSQKIKVRNKNLIDKAIKDGNSNVSTRYKIEKGDIVRFSVDSNEEINKLVLTYDYSEKKLLTGESLLNTFENSPRIVRALPYSVNGDYLEAVDVSTVDFNNLKAKDFEYFKLSRFSNIFKIVEENNSIFVEPATGADIKTYKDYDTSCSTIIVHCVDGEERTMFVYSE